MLNSPSDSLREDAFPSSLHRLPAESGGTDIAGPKVGRLIRLRSRSRMRSASCLCAEVFEDA
jgi:hypothetical protein